VTAADVVSAGSTKFALRYTSLPRWSTDCEEPPELEPELLVELPLVPPDVEPLLDAIPPEVDPPLVDPPLVPPPVDPLLVPPLVDPLDADPLLLAAPLDPPDVEPPLVPPPEEPDVLPLDPPSLPAPLLSDEPHRVERRPTRANDTTRRSDLVFMQLAFLAVFVILHGVAPSMPPSCPLPARAHAFLNRTTQLGAQTSLQEDPVF